ncbi:MAG: iron chelate uptake ABC transporter family permease subunit [Corynebacterium sp.]|nr:iron chelate uptake ABC transporter family permease subunit [Corynebacterium sp.]
MRYEKRSLLIWAILAVVLFAAAVVALMIGDYHISPINVVGAIFGSSADPLATFFVQDMRAPRVVMALLVGLALGLSGCIFQSVTNNPLGSPDITGFSVGAATGALLQIIVFDGGVYAVALGAIVGGAISGLLVYLLARGGGGTRFVLIGIGVSAILSGVNSLLIVRASLQAAQTASVWMSGSFNATTWTQCSALFAALIICVPLALLLARPLAIMTSGDELAHGLGVNVNLRRRQLLGLGIILVAVAVASSGPISFVALAAPQLARRLTKSSGISMLASGLMGAAIVLISDIIAQRIFAPTQLPVGVVTGVLGGIYLIWLLAIGMRKKNS